jgi:ATP-dependent Zn protease
MCFLIILLYVRPDDEQTIIDQKEIMTLEPLDEFSDDDVDFIVYHGQIVTRKQQQEQNSSSNNALWRIIYFLFMSKTQHHQPVLLPNSSTSSMTMMIQLMQILPFCTVIGLVVSWYLRILAKQQSGRHKKIDF